MDEISQEQLEAFILGNYERMSCVSMATELGLKLNGRIYKTCRKLGLKPISVVEEKVLFIREYKGRITKSRAIEILGVVDHQFNKILREYKISANEYFIAETPKLMGPKKKMRVDLSANISARQVLSEYQFDDLIHYKDSL